MGKWMQKVNTRTQRRTNEIRKKKEKSAALRYTWMNRDELEIVVIHTIRSCFRINAIIRLTVMLSGRITLMIVIGIFVMSNGRRRMNHTNTIVTMTFLQNWTEDFSTFVIHRMSWKWTNVDGKRTEGGDTHMYTDIQAYYDFYSVGRWFSGARSSSIGKQRELWNDAFGCKNEEISLRWAKCYWQVTRRRSCSRCWAMASTGNRWRISIDVIQRDHR